MLPLHQSLRLQTTTSTKSANMEILTILTLLVFKHLVVDFVLQREYQWRNKGTYGHLGGIEHAGLHALGTVIVLMFFVPMPVAMALGVLDGLIHYHIDWAKMRINEDMGWKPDTHPEFWILLGLDQFLHTMTYILILYILL